jgi:hypothetical protein
LEEYDANLTSQKQQCEQLQLRIEEKDQVIKDNYLLMQAKSKEMQDLKDLNQKSGSDPAREEEIEQYHEQIR